MAFRVYSGTLLIISLLSIGKIVFFSLDENSSSYDSDQKRLEQLSPEKTYTEDRRRPALQPQIQESQEPHHPARLLEFVHITKTGGTSIEAAAAAAGIKWGICHFQKELSVGCSGSPNIPMTIESLRFKNISPWHQPLQYFALNPFQHADTFAVVRNPYDRYISEYYCPWGGYHAPNENKDDPDVMNKYLQYRIPRETEHHWLPQHFYIYNEGERVVDHVLHFENLEEGFKDLMKRYKLHIFLPSTPLNSRKEPYRLTVKDLYPDTLSVINEVAALDFELFDYEKRFI